MGSDVVDERFEHWMSATRDEPDLLPSPDVRQLNGSQVKYGESCKALHVLLSNFTVPDERRKDAVYICADIPLIRIETF